MKRFFVAIVHFLFISHLAAQDSLKNSSQSNDRVKKNRVLIVGATSAAVYATSLIALNETWYKDYPKTSFHTFNDSGEWLQMDKVGHGWSAYNLSRLSAASWKWAGLSENKSVILGSITGFSYLTVIEILDGHSANWGWSWADMAANVAGSSLFAAQQIGWKEQRIQFKFSAHRKNYEPDLEMRADELFGTSLAERILKDYNGQTLWLSFNINSFLHTKNIPKWLNISVGLGAEGMFGGYENIAYDEDGNETFNRTDIKRYRQWFLSPDIDLTKINTRSKFLRTVLAGLNALKIPAPSLELSNGKLKGNWIHF